jgi:hypothetical protein
MSAQLSVAEVEEWARTHPSKNSHEIRAARAPAPTSTLDVYKSSWSSGSEARIAPYVVVCIDNKNADPEFLREAFRTIWDGFVFVSLTTSAPSAAWQGPHYYFATYKNYYITIFSEK